MNRIEKSVALKSLRSRIIREWYIKGWREVWFYPEWNGVKGWQGTDGIFFVGLNPSTGRFPSSDDQWLYKSLALRGFQSAHLTDVFKLRAKGADVSALIEDTYIMERQRRHFSHELEVLNPRLIVAMGNAADRIVRKWVTALRVETIPHYAPRIKDDRFHIRFLRELDRMHGIYRNHR